MKKGKIIRKILGGAVCMIAGMGLSLVWFLLGIACHIGLEEASKNEDIETVEKEVSDDE